MMIWIFFLFQLLASLHFSPAFASETKLESDSVHENEMHVMAGSDHFDVTIEYAPKRFRPGYVFKITFSPRADVKFKRIRQNYYFLIDRSNSISRGRYFYNKQAVAHALDFLKPGDRFNILTFDGRVSKFSEEALPYSEENILNARDFLEKQGHGGIFAATDLYASLGKIIPQNVAETEVHTAILLSDGDTYLSLEKQRLMIGKWTEKNHGQVSLYTVVSGAGNNLPLLELLTSFNKGSLVYAEKHQDVGTRLAYLMRVIQNPIGKDILATAITHHKGMTILLQPKAKRVPDLYQNRPFVIYGSTNRLHDFVLFVQGSYYDCRFEIKKNISFKEAKLGSPSIEKGWTQLLVQEFYERYFEEGLPTYLEQAKLLLAPLNLRIPLAN